MDREAPDYYVEDTKESLENTIEFVKTIQDMKSDLVTPIITPRFAVSCTDALLEGLGKVITYPNLNILFMWDL